MNKKVLRTIEIARLMQPNFQNGKHFHVTAAFWKSQMIDFAVNDYNHPHLAHRFGSYSPRKEGSNYKPCRHSEAELFRRIKTDTSGLVFVNVRLNVHGVPMMARCCPNCERLLRERGFKKLFYTISENEYGVLE